MKILNVHCILFSQTTSHPLGCGSKQKTRLLCGTTEALSEPTPNAKTQEIPWNGQTCDLTEPMKNYDLKYTWRD